MNFKHPEIPLLIGILVLGGCKSLLPQTWGREGAPAPVVTKSASQTEELLAYFDAVRKMSREEVQTEIVQVRQRTQKNPTAYNHLQLAMLLALPASGSRDTQKALAALDEIHKDDGVPDNGLRNLADYLQPLLAWQAKGEDVIQSLTQPPGHKDDTRKSDTAGGTSALQPDALALQALTQRVKDEQRRAELDHSRQDETIQNLTQKLRDEQKRGELLQQKLDAITTLEKSILDRKPNKPDTSRP